MSRHHFLSLLLVAAAGGALAACNSTEEVAPPPEPVLDPALAAAVDAIRTWAKENRAGCVADRVEVEMPASLREECTFDSRGQLFQRSDSRRVHTRADGEKELALETLLEATTPNLMAARCIFEGVEIAALRSLKVRFVESADEIRVNLQGNCTYWAGSPEQRQRAAQVQLRFPPARGAGQR